MYKSHVSEPNEPVFTPQSAPPHSIPGFLLDPSGTYPSPQQSVQCDTGDLLRPPNSSRDGPVLNINARKVKVLVGVGVPGARQLQDAQVPVGPVGRRRHGNGRHHLLERVAAGRVPEADPVGREVLFGNLCQ